MCRVTLSTHKPYRAGLTLYAQSQGPFPTAWLSVSSTFLNCVLRLVLRHKPKGFISYSTNDILMRPSSSSLLL